MTAPVTGPVFLRLLRDCLRYPVRLIAAVASVAGLGAAQLYLTWLVKRWVEGPLVSGDTAALRMLLIEGGGVMVLAAAAMFLSRFLITAVNQDLVEQLRNRALERVLALDVASLRRFSSGDLMARFLNDASVLSSLLSAVVRRLVRESVVGFGAVVMMFVLNWRLALGTFAVVPLTTLLLFRIGAVIRRWGSLAQTGVGSLGSVLNEQLHGFTTVKGFQAESFEQQRFTERNASFRAKVMTGEFWASTLIALVFLATGIALIVLVWYGSQQLLQGGITQGTLLAFCLFAGQTVEPLRRLSEVHSALAGILPAAERLYQLIDLPTAEPPGGLPRPVWPMPQIRFQEVTFSYGNGISVLRQVNFAIEPGEQVALVGATGCGKSTIAGLLVRYHDPQSGRITLDGVDARDIQLGDLRRAISVVEQEPFLFSGTLRDNIVYGSWQASEDAIEEAARLAGLDTVARLRPGGLRAPVNEAGRVLSGGEKQRIALARAILKNPSVLILDEATSAVDSETEAEIFTRMRRWLLGRTVIAIGHRLSTISRFPRVIVLQDRQIVGDGSPDVLLSTCGAFVSLFADQKGAACQGAKVPGCLA